MSSRLETLQKELDELNDFVSRGKFVPKGVHLTPSWIRGSIARHLKSTGLSQYKFMNDLNVTANEFGKFMKGTPSCDTFLTIAVFFERKRIQDKINELKNKAVAEEHKAAIKESKAAAKELKKPAEKLKIVVVNELVGKGTLCDVVPTENSKLGALQAELDDLNDLIAMGRFRPQSASGDDLTPGRLRGTINKYLTTSGSTQTKFLADIGVNSNSFGKFMKGKYVNPWSACENGTYHSAAVFFARKKIQDQIDEAKGKAAAKEIKKSAKKRKVDEIDDDEGEDAGNVRDAEEVVSVKKAKKSTQSIDTEVLSILAVELPDPSPVYANCDEIRRMINHYLRSSGIPKSRWINHLDINTKSFSNFMGYKGKGAGGNNGTYVAAWRFFEKKRLLEKKPKSAKRLEQEQRWGAAGFPLEHDDGKRRFFPGQYNKNWFDIEWCQDQRHKSL